MPDVLLLSDSDFWPLRADPTYADGPIDAVERAIRAHNAGVTRFQGIVDRNPGEFEGLRVALAAGDGTLTGLRLFGNPPHTRAFLLFDGTTRAMMALMDYGVLNSLRVGAIAGVAAKYLAPPGARVMGLLGSGWQAPPQVQSVARGVPGLERIQVYSPTKANRESFAARMSEAHNIEVVPVDSIEAAVDGADIVDLCAPGHFDVHEPLVELEWVKPGALVISMAAKQLSEEFVLACRVATVNWNSLVNEPRPRPPYDGLIEKGPLLAGRRHGARPHHGRPGRPPPRTRGPRHLRPHRRQRPTTSSSPPGAMSGPSPKASAAPSPSPERPSLAGSPSPSSFPRRRESRPPAPRFRRAILESPAPRSP